MGSQENKRDLLSPCLAFPRYNTTSTTNGNSASAAINKWLKPRARRVCHYSFRHSMRDRLREVQCPADIIDQIGGWSTQGVGQNYGDAYSFKKILDFHVHTILI